MSFDLQWKHVSIRSAILQHNISWAVSIPPITQTLCTLTCQHRAGPLNLYLTPLQLTYSIINPAACQAHMHMRYVYFDFLWCQPTSKLNEHQEAVPYHRPQCLLSLRTLHAWLYNQRSHNCPSKFCKKQEHNKYSSPSVQLVLLLWLALVPLK